MNFRWRFSRLTGGKETTKARRANLLFSGPSLFSCTWSSSHHLVLLQSWTSLMAVMTPPQEKTGRHGKGQEERVLGTEVKVHV